MNIDNDNIITVDETIICKESWSVVRSLRRNHTIKWIHYSEMDALEGEMIDYEY